MTVADRILWEDEYILVINKPNGLMVEPDRNGHANLLQEIKKYLCIEGQKLQEVYVQHIHRLDRPVSGIVLFAKQRSVLKNLSEQFAERRVKKQYEALTDQQPPEMKGILEHWHRKEKKKAMLQKELFPYSEEAKLSYEVVEIAPKRYLWNIELHTGKYHQIRAQLASVGCPIIGDVLYGSVVAYMPNAIALNACSLVFHHPIDGRVIEITQRLFTH